MWFGMGKWVFPSSFEICCFFHQREEHFRNFLVVSNLIPSDAKIQTNAKQDAVHSKKGPLEQNLNHRKERIVHRGGVNQRRSYSKSRDVVLLVAMFQLQGLVTFTRQQLPDEGQQWKESGCSSRWYNQEGKVDQCYVMLCCWRRRFDSGKQDKTG